MADMSRERERESPKLYFKPNQTMPNQNKTKQSKAVTKQNKTEQNKTKNKNRKENKLIVAKGAISTCLTSNSC